MRMDHQDQRALQLSGVQEKVRAGVDMEDHLSSEDSIIRVS